MRETAEDLQQLQAILDRSYASAGDHLSSIHTPDRRLDAASLAERLQGVCVLAVATVTTDGRPLSRPLDGIFYRGEFWFGSAPSSLVLRHIEKRPAVSAVHTVGETLAVTVHGHAFIQDITDDAAEGFRSMCVEIYGDDWVNWIGAAAYARVEADKIFTFLLEETPSR
jgi:general stress protein 26